MEKPAITQYPVQDLIRRRWSPRAFSSEPIPLDVLHSLLEAGRWAASSFNEQPWRYVYASKNQPAEFAQLLSCLLEKNQEWAKGAAVLMLSFMRKTFTHNNKPNRVAMHDVGAASAQLTLEALSRGVFVHQMGGIVEESKIRALYDFPLEFEPVAALALGFPGEPDALPENFRNAEKDPRTRKPAAELFFAGQWGQKA